MKLRNTIGLVVIVCVLAYFLASGSLSQSLEVGTPNCGGDTVNYKIVSFSPHFDNDMCAGFPLTVGAFVEVAARQTSDSLHSGFEVKVDGHQVINCPKGPCLPLTNPPGRYYNNSVYQVSTCGTHTYSVTGTYGNAYGDAGTFTIPCPDQPSTPDQPIDSQNPVSQEDQQSQQQQVAQFQSSVNREVLNISGFFARLWAWLLSLIS
jgi:hypothetical protein